MATYRLVGGPCDGQRSREFTIRPLQGFTIFCGGHDYDFHADGAFHDVGASFGGAGGGVPANAHAHSGFHDVQRAVNVTAAGATMKAAELRRAAQRRLHRRIRRG
jgi:hypothetical protein